MISTTLTREEIEEKVKLMCTALIHGGPDDEGVFFDERANLAFGHRRLSIIDLTKTGHQPMTDVNQKAWITFNGEIYNYRELRAELVNAGAKFGSASDTEVILAAYLHWGIEAFSKLRGMFAFALYDTRKLVTYLVRDRSGIKPVYYHSENGQLNFASEIRAFKAAGIAANADDSWRVRFLAHGNIPEPYTTLKNVYALPKKHFLAWDHHTSSYAIEPYITEPAIPGYIPDIDTAKEEISQSLKNAVRHQLLSDAPIGVLLSGGVDSSLLALLASQENEQLKTVSIYFNEENYNERYYQNVVLGLLKGETFAHLVQQSDFDACLPDIVAAMDMPTTDGINTWFISKYAHSDGLKTVLSGLGADELFGGYPSFERIKYLPHLKQLPKTLLNRSSRLNTDKFRKTSFLAQDHPLADYLFLRGLFVSEDIARVLDMTTEEVEKILFGESLIPELKGYDREHASWLETNIYMQNQLLRDTDVLSMSHGLEVRVPFLDEDFQQLVTRIAPEIRFSRSQPKKLLIESFGKLLPEPVWKRPKMGFTFPLAKWMTKHREIADSSFYKGKAAQEMAEKFKLGALHWSKIFALYQIQLHD